jgi:putative sigma-54 modulation protein
MLRLALFTTIVAVAPAFTVRPSPRALAPRRTAAPRAMSMISSIPDKKPIIVTGDNIEVTDALVEYTTKKVEKVVSRHREFVTKCEVHISVNGNPSVPDNHIATATLSVKGNLIRDSCASDNMYASIDAMSDGLSRKLRKYKERRRSEKHVGESVLRAGVDEEEVGEDGEDDVDEFANEIITYNGMDSVTKMKSFNMEPITVDEAVLCIEYIDHDFYVFRNKESGQVNVLYKRNHGGLGLIEPSS